MLKLRARMAAVIAVVALAGAAAAVGAVTASREGEVGPALHLLANGRALHPYGRLTTLGNFPTGGALTPDGRYYWTVSTGRGRNDVRIVSVRTGAVIQTLPIPGASGGIAMDPKRARVFVSGVPDSSHADQQSPPNTPGAAGDVVHVFGYDRNTGQAAFEDTIPVPAPSDAPTPQDFPPRTGGVQAWPDRLAASPDGSRLLVPLNLADRAAIVNVATKAVSYVATGNYPYGAAILPDGKTGLVSNETPGTVSVVDLDTATKVKDITVGPHLSHPEAIAVDPKAARAYVALANSDQVAVIDTQALTLERTLSVDLPEGAGSAPVALTVTPDGRRLLVAESGADDIAVFRLPSAAARASAARRRAERVLAHEARAAAGHGSAQDADAPEPEDRPARAALQRVSADFELIGRIPTAAYPADVQVTPGRSARLLYVSAKGLGVGPNPNGPNPYLIHDDNANSFQYLPLLVTGAAGSGRMPTDSQVRRLTPVAARQIRPTNAEQAPAGTPLRANGPIKHVFYIVKENRTYDQVLGDVAKGDGDPNLAIFGDQPGNQVTPNAHALVDRFPLLDHVYANSEASIDGHFWTSAAKTSDYVHKAWMQNYGGRNRPYDFGVYAVTWPRNGFLFDQAERQGISWFNYGEAIAGTVPFADKDRTPDDNAAVAAKTAKSDLGQNGCYPNDSSIDTDSVDRLRIWDSTPPAGSPPDDKSRFECFKNRFTAQVAANQVPAFNYMVLLHDHTVGSTPGRRTPRAMVADNDYALGEIVDQISHSSIWSSSAIFVIEDDSQDGPDHVDAHRMPAFVISPYAKQGAVIHKRYDMLSVIRSLELILGMQPLGLFDNLATPMYDAFSSTPDNSAPFTAVAPTWDRTEMNPSTAANRAAARGLNLKGLDRTPQYVLDRSIWVATHGSRRGAPPPGPNNVPGG